MAHLPTPPDALPFGATQPTEAQLDRALTAPEPDAYTKLSDEALVSEVYHKYDIRRQMRRPYEIQWYLNASALRGFPDVRWNAELNRVEMKKEPAHRKRRRINHIKPKYVARVAKYTKIPPNPTVVPATTDREDIQNARASQKMLEYFTRKGALRAKYMQAMQWVPLTGKAFWWLSYNEDTLAYAPTHLDGQREPILGEIDLQYGSAFEFLPADPGIEVLADQPEIMRARLVPIKDIEKAYPHAAPIAAESSTADLFFYQRQIADLGTRQQGVTGGRASNQIADDPNGGYALQLELFKKPCAQYEQGQYVVVAGHKLLKRQDSLPGGFLYTHRNPYPCVEFSDDIAPGQFWPDAFVERLVGLSSEYNEYRSQMSENMAMHFFPKLVVSKQLNLDAGAYTSEAGERIDLNTPPGVPLPTFLQPANVIGDAWNILNTIRREMDDITLIYPSAVGGTGGANSGFQTNLLQEAADQVHGPAIARNAMALEEAYIKIRHLMKTFYTIPRLITIAGKNNIPELYEFTAEQVDEQADVRIEPETMMPMLRSVRVDMIRGMYGDGLFGDTSDPATKQRVMDMIRMGYADFEIDRDQRDAEQAQLENVRMTRNEDVPKPMVWENHKLHWEAHVDLFKSPEAVDWSEAQLTQYAWHALVHLSYIDQAAALKMAGEFGLRQQLQELLSLQQEPAPPPPPQAPAAQAAPGGGFQVVRGPDGLIQSIQPAPAPPEEAPGLSPEDAALMQGPLDLPPMADPVPPPFPQ